MIIGALSNLIRGGSHKKFIPHWGKIELRQSITDKALYRILDGRLLNALIFFAFVNHYTQDPIIALLSGILMWCGSAIGWGDYISAIFNVVPDSRRNHLGIIEKPFEKYFESDNVKWGVILLSIRGFLWGLLLSAPFLNPIPALAGASMGLVYLYSWKYVGVCGFKHKVNSAWTISEAVFGLILWGAVYQAM